jgi:hypothetical protein
VFDQLTTSRRGCGVDAFQIVLHQEFERDFNTAMGAFLDALRRYRSAQASPSHANLKRAAAEAWASARSLLRLQADWLPLVGRLVPPVGNDPRLLLFLQTSVRVLACPESDTRGVGQAIDEAFARLRAMRRR